MFCDRFIAIVCNPPNDCDAQCSAGSGGCLYDFAILLSLCPIGKNWEIDLSQKYIWLWAIDWKIKGKEDTFWWSVFSEILLRKINKRAGEILGEQGGQFFEARLLVYKVVESTTGYVMSNGEIKKLIKKLIKNLLKVFSYYIFSYYKIIYFHLNEEPIFFVTSLCK